MKTKWLWTTWAPFALIAVIALELLIIYVAAIDVVPRFQRLVFLGLIHPPGPKQHSALWMPSFLGGLRVVCETYTPYIALLVLAAWGLFEWRVRGQNKPFIRLSVLGTVALGLMVIVALTAGSIIMPMVWSITGYPDVARPFALQQIEITHAAVGELERAKAAKDWEAMQQHANRASQAVAKLSNTPAVAVSVVGQDKAAVDEFRSQVNATDEGVRAMQQAIRDKDAVRLDPALTKFHEAFASVQAAAKKEVE